MYRWCFLQSWRNGDYVLLSDINIDTGNINRTIVNPFVIAFRPVYNDGWQFNQGCWTFSNIINAMLFVFDQINVEEVENEEKE